jgi:hypothetical protein
LPVFWRFWPGVAALVYGGDSGGIGGWKLRGIEAGSALTQPGKDRRQANKPFFQTGL